MKISSFILAALGALTAGAYYYEKQRKLEHSEYTPPQKPWSMSENGMDEELDESFPSSDPPSWSSSGLH